MAAEDDKTVGAAIGGLVAIALVGALAWSTHATFLAPPLGATALLCFQMPRSPGACPRNIALGHACGMLCGWLALWATGALGNPSTLAGLGAANAAACSFALAATMLLMNALDCVHPPAGATTLVVALGLIQQPMDMLALQGGGLVVAGTALLCHRWRGVDYPIWSHPREE